MPVEKKRVYTVFRESCKDGDEEENWVSSMRSTLVSAKLGPRFILPTHHSTIFSPSDPPMPPLILYKASVVAAAHPKNPMFMSSEKVRITHFGCGSP